LIYTKGIFNAFSRVNNFIRTVQYDASLTLLLPEDYLTT